ncbi:response regulator [Proteobacteria bacterium 005FR1]|nr:response regulator [Proteobacteria bacterium 005FR1]
MSIPALLVQNTGTQSEQDLAFLRNQDALKAIGFVAVSEADAADYLCTAAAAGEEPAVVVVAPGVLHITSLVLAMQKCNSSTHLIFLQIAEQVSDLQQKIATIPAIGLRWSAVSLNEPGFAEKILHLAEAARQRQRLQLTLARANRQIRSFRSESRQQTQTTLSDYYLAAFLAHTQDAIIATDAELRVRYWSSGAARLFNLGEEQAIGRMATELPFCTPEIEYTLDRIPRYAETLTVEARCSLDHRTLTVESVCSAVRDENARFMGVTLVIRDISQRRQKLEAERAAQRRATRLVDSERRRLLFLFQQAPGFIAVTAGSNHVFEVVNDAWLQVVGNRSILDKPAAEALPEMQGQDFLALLDQVYESGEPHVGRSMAIAVRRQSGAQMETRFVDFVFQPILETDGSISGIFCQGHDVTEQKLVQEKLAAHQTRLEELVEKRTAELQASQEALQRSQKLEAIGQLTGGVAHDFNNVLQIISGNLQLLQLLDEEADTAEQSRHYLATAIEAVERGSKLSSQLLAFARRQPLRPASVDLGQVLKGMDDLLRRALGETVEMETVVTGGLWATLVDPHQLENVVLNLALNARDAMPNGGKLTLEASNALLDDHYVITAPDVPPGQYVLLAISDTGHGMTPEVIERAFEPFFTTKKEGQGTGLGLSMAYGFTRQSGGHIRIYSELGNGTTFKIYLPRSFKPAAEPLRQLRGPARGGTETILVVEDDQAVRDTVVSMLEDLDYTVLQASSGESALSILESGATIDLLFTDVVMPGPVLSTEVAARATELFPDIAVLFTSGYTQNAIVHGGRLDPGVQLLSKPYRREDLARKLRRMLDEKAEGSRTERLDTPPSQKLRILVVEDESDSRRALCKLLEALDHQPRGAIGAEEAMSLLRESSFDLLITDVNLPGRSGLELAEYAKKLQPHIGIIVASGAQLSAELAIQPQPVSLLKPFDLAGLQNALEKVAKSRPQ